MKDLFASDFPPEKPEEIPFSNKFIEKNDEEEALP